MTFKRKVLGAVLAAVFAMSAVAVSGATGDEFDSEGHKTVMGSGSQKNTTVFKTTAGSSECLTATSSGTGKAPRTTVTLSPSYSNCSCLGLKCTGDMNECDFLVHIDAGTTGTADIVCPEGKEMTATSTKCSFHWPPQKGVGTVTFTNVGSGTTQEVEIELNLVGVKYSHTEGTGIGKCTTGSATNGTLANFVTLTAVEDGGSAHVGIFVK